MLISQLQFSTKNSRDFSLRWFDNNLASTNAKDHLRHCGSRRFQDFERMRLWSTEIRKMSTPVRRIVLVIDFFQKPVHMNATQRVAEFEHSITNSSGIGTKMSRTWAWLWPIKRCCFKVSHEALHAKQSATFWIISISTSVPGCAVKCRPLISCCTMPYMGRIVQYFPVGFPSLEKEWPGTHT